MSRILFQLAYRNIKKYHRHYRLMILLTFTLSVFFMTCMMSWGNFYNAQKDYRQRTYGTWYVRMDIQKENQSLVENALLQRQAHYGYIVDQGETSTGYSVGSILSDSLYELCHLEIIAGHQPLNADELMISQQMQQEKHLSLNQEIELTIDETTKSYTIVGILKKSQDFFVTSKDEEPCQIFPDVYTFYSKGNQYELFIDQTITLDEYGQYVLRYQDQELIWSQESVRFNPFGYNALVVLENFHYSSQELLFLVESMALALIGFFALTATSLKRRQKEMALLRGIGMTTHQLFWMVFDEMMMTSLIGAILGVIASFLVSYGLSFYFESLFGCFVYELHLMNIWGYFMIILGFIVISFVQPIFFLVGMP